MSWYLTVYDYGMGAVYTYIEAESPQAIRARYPQLVVLSAPPRWMDEQTLAELRREGRKLGDSDGFLGALDRPLGWRVTEGGRE